MNSFSLVNQEISDSFTVTKNPYFFFPLKSLGLRAVLPLLTLPSSLSLSNPGDFLLSLRGCISIANMDVT